MSDARGQGKPTNVAITGASSGLGAELARRYAGTRTALLLLGRDEARLAATAEAARAVGATVETRAVEVTDREGMAQALAAFDDAHPLDQANANAGITGHAPGVRGHPDAGRRILRVNTEGVLNTIEPLIPRMAARRRGQLALIASLASYYGFASSPSYSASKAWVRTYGEGLRARLKPDGIAVSVVCPGFVDTPMTTDNPYPMPMKMTVERAGAIVVRGLERRRPVIAFPWPMWLGAHLTALLPRSLLDRGQGRVPSKEL